MLLIRRPFQDPKNVNVIYITLKHLLSAPPPSPPPSLMQYFVQKPDIHDVCGLMYRHWKSWKSWVSKQKLLRYDKIRKRLNYNSKSKLIFLAKAKNPPFWGYCHYCLPSWKILDNSNNVKSDFKSCNCKFTIIQTTILKSCISLCGDFQTWERPCPKMAKKERQTLSVRKTNCVPSLALRSCGSTSCSTRRYAAQRAVLLASAANLLGSKSLNSTARKMGLSLNSHPDVSQRKY